MTDIYCKRCGTKVGDNRRRTCLKCMTDMLNSKLFNLSPVKKTDNYEGDPLFRQEWE